MTSVFFSIFFPLLSPSTQESFLHRSTLLDHKDKLGQGSLALCRTQDGTVETGSLTLTAKVTSPAGFTEYVLIST